MTDPNEPAYPNRGDGSRYDGLTKREYFAALIIAGLTCKDTGTFQSDATAAVFGADALIAELNK